MITPTMTSPSGNRATTEGQLARSGHGTFIVTIGRRRRDRIMARLAGYHRDGPVPMGLTITATPDGDRWERTVDGRSVPSTVRWHPGQETALEQVGPLRLTLRVSQHPDSTPPDSRPDSEPAHTPPGSEPEAEPAHTPPGSEPDSEPAHTPPGSEPGSTVPNPTSGHELHRRIDLHRAHLVLGPVALPLPRFLLPHISADTTPVDDGWWTRVAVTGRRGHPILSYEGTMR